MKQIVCSNVSLGYEGRTIAENIGFEVNRGDYLCIVGENGSGKSTLIKALLGQVTPVSGKISIMDCGIGYLPQQTDVQRDFPASVCEVVMSGCISGGAKLFYSRGDKAAAKGNMKKLGIWELRDKCYRDLSGGQQQRVLLCRALCAAKDILLMDEPVTGLDPLVTEELYDMIAQLNREGMTVIMVSHDISAAVRYASHILHIGENPLFFGKKEDYILSEAARGYMKGAE